MISITVTGDTPQILAAHVAWLSDKLGGTDVIADVIEHKEKKAKVTAEKAISKAKDRDAEGSAPAHSTPVDVAPTIKELMDLASAKSKIVGSERVKGVIGACGAKTIKELPADRLPELKLNLEMLS